MKQLVRQLFAVRLFFTQIFLEAADELQFLRRLCQRVLLLDEGTFQALLCVAQPSEVKQNTKDLFTKLLCYDVRGLFERPSELAS